MDSTFAGFDVADLRSRWIQLIVPNAGFWLHPGSNVFPVFIQVDVSKFVGVSVIGSPSLFALMLSSVNFYGSRFPYSLGSTCGESVCIVVVDV